MPFQSVAGIFELLFFEDVADIIRNRQHADVADRHILAGNVNFVFAGKVAAQSAKLACDVVASLCRHQQGMPGLPDALSRGIKQRLGNGTRIGAADRLSLRFDRRGDRLIEARASRLIPLRLSARLSRRRPRWQESTHAGAVRPTLAMTR